MTEKLFLKWKHFEARISSSFEILRKEKDFFDVTLVSDDEVHVQAHKVVLSACSPFFKDMLKKNSHPNPMLFLYGIKIRDLEHILEYFYSGKVQMYQDEMDPFLKLAVKLKIPGLKANISAEAEAQKVPAPTPIPEPIEKKLLKLEPVIEPLLSDPLIESLNEADVDDPLAIGDDNTDTEEDASYVEVDDEEKRVTLDINAITKEAEAITKKKIESTVVGKVKPHFSQYVDKIGTGVNGSYLCRLCKAIVKDQTKLRDHIENHIYGLSYPCHQCGKEFKSNVILANHLQTHLNLMGNMPKHVTKMLL